MEKKWKLLKKGCIGTTLGAAPLSNSWTILIIWLYITLKRTPNIDFYLGGPVPKDYFKDSFLHS